MGRPKQNRRQQGLGDQLAKRRLLAGEQTPLPGSGGRSFDPRMGAGAFTRSSEMGRTNGGTVFDWSRGAGLGSNWNGDINIGAAPEVSNIASRMNQALLNGPHGAAWAEGMNMANLNSRLGAKNLIGPGGKARGSNGGAPFSVLPERTPLYPRSSINSRPKPGLGGKLGNMSGMRMLRYAGAIGAGIGAINRAGRALDSARNGRMGGALANGAFAAGLAYTAYDLGIARGAMAQHLGKAASGWAKKWAGNAESGFARGVGKFLANGIR